MLYDTNDLCFSEDKTNDVIEMNNHFRLFDYMLDTYDEKLSEELIIKYHKLLKTSTSQSYDINYNVGGYKVHSNVIGIVNIINTSNPDDVEKDMKDLISDYNSKKDIDIYDIIDFHYRFETIHPFSDGNGRVGRMIMFKECLKNSIVPFVVLDEYKAQYINGLNKYKRSMDKNYLIECCLFFQDNYKHICNQTIGNDFDIVY